MIWLVRHGETTWNAEGRYQGRRESHLSELGVRQASALAAHFSRARDRGEPVPRRIIASPLARTLETAAPIARELEIDVETDERLIEIAHGTWDGKYKHELERDDPERYAAWRSHPQLVAFDGGERLRDVMTRWRSFATDVLLVRSSSDATNTDILVMTHDAVVRCALLALRGDDLANVWRMHVENASFALAERSDDDAIGTTLRLVSECETEHLRDARGTLESQAL